MLFRTIFKDFGKPPRSTTMVRVIEVPGGYMNYTRWVQEQELKKIAEAAERNARMPTSERESYDFSFKRPSSEKASYDFTF